MSSAPVVESARVNGFRLESFSAESALASRGRVAPLLRDSAGGMERLAVTSREPGFSLVTVSTDDRVVGYAAATLTSVESPDVDLPAVTVGGFTAQDASERAAARGRGEALPAPTRTEARRIDPLVIDPELDTITTDQVARGLVHALLDGRPDQQNGALPVLVHPASPAVAVLLRAGWHAGKTDPLSAWDRFELPQSQ